MSYTSIDKTKRKISYKNGKCHSRFTTISKEVNHLQKWEWLIELCAVGTISFSFIYIYIYICTSLLTSLAATTTTTTATAGADVSHFRHDFHIDSLRSFISGLFNVTWFRSPAHFANENWCLIIDLISFIIIISIP